MARVVGIGYQDFSELITSGCFYVDKTDFIREWWENQDVVTLIARPRRFGKTLNMSMLERFFSKIIFDQLDHSDSAVWSLFLAGGYLKADVCQLNDELGKEA